jgi:hypothetical protein
MHKLCVCTEPKPLIWCSFQNGETKEIQFEDIDENKPVNSVIGRLQGSSFEAKDIDDAQYAKVYYYIISEYSLIFAYFQSLKNVRI